MPKLLYKIGYIDLKQNPDDFWRGLDCRTEIRKAQKSNIEIRLATGDERIKSFDDCHALLHHLLERELVPYSDIYDRIIKDEDNLLFLALIDGEIASFIVVSKKAKNNYFSNSKSAFLELSATNDKYKSFCPNYLLIWSAIEHLREDDFDFFNLGLLNYVNCSDDNLNRVAFFKRKWNIREVETQENCSHLKFFYYSYLKKYEPIRKLIYMIKVLANKR